VRRRRDTILLECAVITVVWCAAVAAVVAGGEALLTSVSFWPAYLICFGLLLVWANTGVRQASGPMTSTMPWMTCSIVSESRWGRATPSQPAIRCRDGRMAPNPATDRAPP
jgi:hypothetical protein